MYQFLQNHSSATRKAVVTLSAAALLAGTLAACGSSSNQPGSQPAVQPVSDVYQPPGSGPTIKGTPYCAWVADASECTDSGIPQDHWMQMPQSQPSNYSSDTDYSSSNDIYLQMFYWHLLYSQWYAPNGFYYNHYVPQSSRTTYVTTVNHFNTTYHSQESAVASKAVYKSPSGKTVTGDKVDTTKLGSVKNNGGTQSSNCPKSMSPLGAQPTYETAAFVVPSTYKPKPKPYTPSATKPSSGYTPPAGSNPTKGTTGGSRGTGTTGTGCR